MMEKDPEQDEIYRWALDELATQMSIQIGEDGMLWEQSTMYHVEVLNNVLRVLDYVQWYVIPASGRNAGKGAGDDAGADAHDDAGSSD